MFSQITLAFVAKHQKQPSGIAKTSIYLKISELASILILNLQWFTKFCLQDLNETLPCKIS